MLDNDTPVVIASQLTSMEAGMLRGFLESAGISALVIDRVTRTTLVEPGMGGAQLAVRADDAERALEIIRSAGTFPGPSSDEPVDIPEEEWSRDASSENAVEVVRGSSLSTSSWPKWLVTAAVIALMVWFLAFR